MAYILSPVLQGQVFTNQGKPAAGYKVFAYQAGSFSTLVPTYTNSTGAVANPNPVTLDASGRVPPIFLDTNVTYNLVLTQADGTTVVQSFNNPTTQLSDVMFKTGGNALTGAQTVAFVTLTDAASIETDARLSNNFVVTLGGNRTLANPSNLRDGGIYAWVIRQNGTGGFTLAYGNKFKFPNGVLPTIAAGANDVSIIVGQYIATLDILLCTFALDYS